MPLAPYGSWVSPISSELIVSSTVRLSGIEVDGDDVYWLELRPAEAGRSVLVRKRGDTISDITVPPFNVRTLAHEYGGGPYTVSDGIVYFVNYTDQKLYQLKPGGKPEPLTPEGKFHYADLLVDKKRNRLICVQEDLSDPGQEALTTIVSISLDKKNIETLIAGNDFYAFPALHPDGLHMAWMSWNHPNMPWDDSCIWAANLGADGLPSNIRKVAGSPGESVFQPQWAPDGSLYYISDRSGFWNLYLHSDYEAPEEIAPMQAEFGTPVWVFGLSTYAFASPDKLVCTYGQKGSGRLAVINLPDRRMHTLDTPFTDFSYVRALGSKIYACAGSPESMPAIVEVDTANGKAKILKKSGDVSIDEKYISRPETIEFDTQDNRKAFAFYYPPRNKDYSDPESELPPLIVKSHGGPTSACSSVLNLGIQYWTSRGFAVVDVNYGGSSGFGRRYRERLNGAWGVVDVEDCINAAKYLVAQGKVDKERLAITGGSAGGYTTLSALTQYDFFKAGASHYGVSDLEALAKDTHKFESRYLDRLIGPYPQEKQLYVARSPLTHADKLRCPTIFFQGLEDKVVPPDQSERMIAALRKNKVPCAYVTFEGEQHGFRKAENIKRALDCELYFYSRIFRFQLPGNAPSLEIENLSAVHA